MQDLDFSRFTFVIRGIPVKDPSSSYRGSTRTKDETPVGCAKLRGTVVSS
ncbi:hypothetical protein BH23BAC2_BH23BAC2_06830 [soil metagenome]